jgi:AcrR family transcriptional regulator
MPDAVAPTARRDTYRHGDLRRALVRAGVELAKEGGPDAVVLREVTRRVGVAPNAAYRHFADLGALLRAVCAVAQSALAIAMERELAQLPPADGSLSTATDRLRAVGTAYLRFALDQPGLFRTAFTVAGDVRYATDPSLAGHRGRTAFQVVSSALDDLVDAGGLPESRRAGAELLAWSAVHGLATLLIDGPLHELDQDTAYQLGGRLFDMVEKGL